MSRPAWGVLLLLLLGITMLFSAPARLLGLVLPEGKVYMQGYSGTVWRGSASRCLIHLGSGYLHLGAVRWSLAPLSLLSLAPRLELDSAWGRQVIAGDVVVRGQQDIELHDFEASVAADLLRLLAPVALEGTLSVELEHLLLEEGLPVQGSGRLVWHNGSWQSPRGALPLGTYALDFQQESGAVLEGRVVTVSGPVEADGTVRLQDREYAVDILVSGQQGLDEQLQQALSLIARPVPKGHRIKLDGEF